MRTNMNKKAAFLRYANKEKAKGKNYHAQVVTLLFVFIFVSSCATLEVSALKLYQPKEALTYVEAPDRVDPNYAKGFTLLRW